MVMDANFSLDNFLSREHEILSGLLSQRHSNKAGNVSTRSLLTLFSQIPQFCECKWGTCGEFCYCGAVSLYPTHTQGLFMLYLSVYYGPYLCVDFFWGVFPYL